MNDRLGRILGRGEEDCFEVQRVEDPLPEYLVGGLSGDGFDDQSDHVVTDCVVGVSGAWSVLRTLRDGPVDDFSGFEHLVQPLGGLQVEPEVKGVLGKAVGVVQELAHRDGISVVDAVKGVAGKEVTYVRGCRLVESDEPFGYQLEEGDRRDGFRN